MVDNLTKKELECEYKHQPLKDAIMNVKKWCMGTLVILGTVIGIPVFVYQYSNDIKLNKIEQKLEDMSQVKETKTMDNLAGK